MDPECTSILRFHFFWKDDGSGFSFAEIGRRLLGVSFSLHGRQHGLVIRGVHVQQTFV